MSNRKRIILTLEYDMGEYDPQEFVHRPFPGEPKDWEESFHQSDIYPSEMTIVAVRAERSSDPFYEAYEKNYIQLCFTGEGEFVAKENITRHSFCYLTPDCYVAPCDVHHPPDFISVNDAKAGELVKVVTTGNLMHKSATGDALHAGVIAYKEAE